MLMLKKLLEIKGTQDLIITNTLSYYDAAEDDHYVGVNYINDKSLMVNLDLEAGSIDNISKNKIGASNDYELGDEIKITYYNGEEKTYNVVAVFKSVPYLLLPKIYIDYNSNEFLQGLEKIDNKLYMSNSSIGKAELEKKVKKYNYICNACTYQIPLYYIYSSNNFRYCYDKNS